jgi:predicted negative regulator of RcsB-dependent stress response
MSTNQEMPSVEETLNKTDLGHIINENKRPIMIVFGIALVLILGYSVMTSVQATKHKEKLDKVFTIEQTVFTTFLGLKDGEIKPEQLTSFKTAMAGISNEFLAHPSLTPPFIEALNKLDTAQALDDSVLKMAQTWIGKMDKRGHMYTISAIRVAGLLEDRSKADESIAILEGIIANKTEFLLDRVNFDLGRIFYKKGNKEKATAHLTKVMETEQSEFKTIAKIYLSEL